MKDPHAFLRRRSRISGWEIAFWMLALAVPYLFFPTWLSFASQIAITAMFCVSLDLILGYAGIISLGHAAFFGLGAYAAGILSANGWGEPVSGLLFAGAFAGLAGWIVSFLIVRVAHLALLMITLGLSFLLVELANAMSWLTGGADSLRGIDTWDLFGIWGFSIWGHTSYGYAFAVAFLAFLVARRIVHSPFGLTLEAVRENPRRTDALGISNQARLREIFTLSAVMAGMAGGLLAQTTETVSLEALGFQRSAEIAIMLILGGTGRLYGAILGSMVFLLARDQLAGMAPQYWYFWIGLLLMLVVLFMPRGLLGGLERAARLFRLRP
jgi:branched-chain amino acid transport system permease protein